MTWVEIANLAISVAALGVAAFALWQVARLRKRDLALKVHAEAVDLGRRLASVLAQAPGVYAEWRALLAARGLLHSGQEVMRKQSIESINERSMALRDQLGSVPREFRFWQWNGEEAAMKRLHAITAETVRLEQDLDDLQRELRDRQGLS